VLLCQVHELQKKTVSPELSDAEPVQAGIPGQFLHGRSSVPGLASLACGCVGSTKYSTPAACDVPRHNMTTASIALRGVMAFPKSHLRVAAGLSL
jgi:hypothetical protein